MSQGRVVPRGKVRNGRKGREGETRRRGGREVCDTETKMERWGGGNIAEWMGQGEKRDILNVPCSGPGAAEPRTLGCWNWSRRWEGQRLQPNPSAVPLMKYVVRNIPTG